MYAYVYIATIGNMWYIRVNIFCYNTIGLYITNNNQESQVEGQTKDCHFVCLSPLSLIFPNTCLHLLCLVLFVLGYGWKRLDFDIFLEDRQSGLPPLQRFLHCSAEGSHPKRFSWTPCNHSTNLVVLFCFLTDSEHPTDYFSLVLFSNLTEDSKTTKRPLSNSFE